MNIIYHVHGKLNDFCCALTSSEITPIKYICYWRLHAKEYALGLQENFCFVFPSEPLEVVKGVLYLGSRIYNHLPFHIKGLINDIKQFKVKLRTFLLEHSCYSIDEFYQTISELSLTICIRLYYRMN